MRNLTHRLSAGLTLLVVLGFVLSTTGCSSGWSRNQVGKRNYTNGNYTAARRSFEQAMMNDPWNPDYAFNVAAAMQKQGDSIAAERMYQHALTLSPGHQPSYHALAGLLHDEGRTDEAQELLTAWVDTQPYTPESHIEMAHMQQELGDYSSAEASLQQALQRNPRHPRAMAQLGQVYERSGRTAEAAAMYRRALAYDRRQAQVATRLRSMGGASYGPSSMMMAQQQSAYDPWMAASPYGSPPMGAMATGPGGAAPYTAFMSPQYGPPVAQANSWQNSPAGYPGIAPHLSASGYAAPAWSTAGSPYPTLTQASPSYAGQLSAAPQMMTPATVTYAPQPQMMIPSTTAAMSPTNVMGPMLGTAPAGAGVAPGPSYAQQPVQLGTPAPISQNPSAGIPAISAVVPVVRPF